MELKNKRMDTLEVQITEVPNACKYCRELMKLPEPPKILKLYRNEMLCLIVDVESASKLSFYENDRGMGYKKYKPFKGLQKGGGVSH